LKSPVNLEPNGQISKTNNIRPTLPWCSRMTTIIKQEVSLRAPRECKMPHHAWP